eukprot:m.267088 g.267088  ORF g.267088 m.267088 type:complete len:139 (-) comp16243_c1_seq6:2429-2845(-)
MHCHKLLTRYAVINMREVEGHRLVHIKNPWNKGRWKGNWSPRHTQMWKPSIRKALNYNPELASQKDDGEFWMDLASVVNFYDVFHLNWNPGLFPHNYSTHYCWSQSAGNTFVISLAFKSKLVGRSRKGSLQYGRKSTI